MTRFVLPALALPAGYLLGWFLYGLAPLPVLGIVVPLALFLAFLSGTRRGAVGFLRLLTLLLLAGVVLGLLGGGLILALMLFSPNNPLPIGLKQFWFMLAGGLVIIAACLWLGRWLTRSLEGEGAIHVSPAAPFLLMAGVLLFAFYPFVRVDCRGLQRADSFLSNGSGFAGNLGQNYWSRKPELIVDRAQLPQNFVPDVVQVAATRCEHTATNRHRPLSFGQSSPLVLVYLIKLDKAKFRPQDTFAALFTPVAHAKQTPWTRASQPYPYGGPEPRPNQHYPYRNPAWVVYPY